MKYVIGLTIVFIFLGSFFGNKYFFESKNAVLDFFTRDNKEENRIQQLVLENESLKAKILSLEFLRPELVKKDDLVYYSAKVYSTYPFNHRNLFTINLGSKDGVEEMMAVALKPGVLIGQITEVFRDYSVVKSIFDSNFKIAVRIGSSQIDALLEGGNKPVLTMIDKTSGIKTGDSVYTAGLDFPYGMKVGITGEIFEDQKGGFFKKAFLETSYDVGDFKEVFVVTSYNSQPK